MCGGWRKCGSNISKQRMWREEMACPNNHSPGAAVHSARRAGCSPLSVSFQCSTALQAALYGQALTPTGSVNRGQVLKSNPPILTSIKEEWWRWRGVSTEASEHLGRGPFKARQWFIKQLYKSAEMWNVYSTLTFYRRPCDREKQRQLKLRTTSFIH